MCYHINSSESLNKKLNLRLFNNAQVEEMSTAKLTLTSNTLTEKKERTMEKKNIKKIDIHAHAIPFPEYSPRWLFGEHWISAERIIEIYDKVGVEKGLLLPIESPEGFVQTFNTCDTIYVANKYPDRFLWACNLDARCCDSIYDTDFDKLLKHYKSLGAKSFGELTSRLYADDPKMDKLFGACEDNDLPVTIHISQNLNHAYGIVDDLGLPRLESMLKKHKNLKVLGHSMCFWSEISATNTNETRGGYPKGKVTEGRIAQLMREYEGLYCDFSAGSGLNAMKRDPEYIARFIEEFSDRVLFGLDMCYAFNDKDAVEYEQWLSEMLDKKYISEENYYKFVRGNAIKLLKLEQDK